MDLVIFVELWLKWRCKKEGVNSTPDIAGPPMRESNGIPAKVLGKRARGWDKTEERIATEILARQIDLEIALRKRSAEAANAKISWAESMRAAVVEGIRTPAAIETHSTSFQEESLQTLRAIDLLIPSAASSSSSPAKIPVSDSNAGKEKPPSVDTVDIGPLLSGHVAPYPSDPPQSINHKKPLFIHSQPQPDSPFITLLIACEFCDRSEFSTILALINHTRISHSTSYRSHEECIERCGRIVTGDEALRIRHNGIEAPADVRPSVRRIFERALGGMDKNRTSVFKTLGYHADSPALATYLGKAIRKPQINVYEPTEDIDVETLDTGLKTRDAFTRWRPHFNFIPRTIEEDTYEDLPIREISSGLDPTSPPLRAISDRSQELLESTELSGSATRFHIKRRIIITDWNRFVPEKRRPQSSSSLTHEWMLTLTSPSYTHHVTTFVARLIVSCVTDPPPACFTSSPELVANKPPFSVMARTEKPFLARLKLEWTGGPSKPLVVEHWVRIGASKQTSAVMGEEQTLDVELDRSTTLRPQLNVPPLRWGSYASESTTVPDPPDTAPIISNENQVEVSQLQVPSAKIETQWQNTTPASPKTFESVLHPLASKIPLTQEDIKVKGLSAQHANLPLTRAQFISAVHGRRKAAEWRHALSLHATFIEHVATDPDLSRRLKEAQSITVGALYRWLGDMNFFPKKRRKINQPAVKPKTSGEGEKDVLKFCSYCGLSTHQHSMSLPAVKSENGTPSFSGQDVNVCPEADYCLSLPMYNVRDWINAHPPSANGSMISDSLNSRPPARFSSHDLVHSVDPNLVRFVQQTIRSSRNPRFPPLYLDDDDTGESGSTTFPLDQLGATTAAVDAALAPMTLLSHVVQLVVRDLVQAGIASGRTAAEVVRARMRSQTGSFARPNVSPGSDPNVASHQVLTPAHILMGLGNNSVRMSRLQMVIGELGVGKGGLGVRSAPTPVSREGFVKVEPDLDVLQL